MRLLSSLIPVILAAVLYVGVDIWPQLASKEVLLGVASCFAITWAGMALALPKLSELMKLEGMTTSQREQLATNIKLAREKIWRIGGISLLCVITLFILSVVTRPEYARYVAVFVGLAVGFVIELLFAYRRWHNEIDDFSAGVLQRHFEEKARAETLRQMSSNSP